MYFSELNSQDVHEQIHKTSIAILPIGAIEAHGAHLPLGTDNYLAEALAKRIVEKIPAWILPTVSYGQTWSLQDFPGSFHIPPQVLEEYLLAIVSSAAKNNFKLFVFINAHLGNHESIKQVQRKILALHPECRTLNLFYPDANKFSSQVLEQSRGHGNFFHADELETSYMLHLCPKHVVMEKAINENIKFPEDIDYRPILWSEFSKTAVMGNATLATEEKGKFILEPVIQNMISIINKQIEDLLSKEKR